MKLKLFLMCYIYTSSPKISSPGLRKEEQILQLFSLRVSRKRNMKRLGCRMTSSDWKKEPTTWSVVQFYCLSDVSHQQGSTPLAKSQSSWQTIISFAGELQSECFTDDSVKAAIWQLRLLLCKWICFNLVFLHSNYFLYLASSLKIEISLTVIA